jgi:hypothetical protein
LLNSKCVQRPRAAVLCIRDIWGWRFGLFALLL